MPSRIVLLIPKMLDHLGIQRGLEDVLGQSSPRSDRALPPLIRQTLSFLGSSLVWSAVDSGDGSGRGHLFVGCVCFFVFCLCFVHPVILIGVFWWVLVPFWLVNVVGMVSVVVTVLWVVLWCLWVWVVVFLCCVVVCVSVQRLVFAASALVGPCGSVSWKLVTGWSGTARNVELVIPVLLMNVSPCRLMVIP